MEKKGGIFVIVHSIFLVLFHLEYQLGTFSLPESQALQPAAAPGSDTDPGWLSASRGATRAAVQAAGSGMGSSGGGGAGRWAVVGTVVEAGRQAGRQAVVQAGSRAGSIVGGQWYKQPFWAAVQAALRAGRKGCR